MFKILTLTAVILLTSCKANDSEVKAVITHDRNAIAGDSKVKGVVKHGRTAVFAFHDQAFVSSPIHFPYNGGNGSNKKQKKISFPFK